MSDTNVAKTDARSTETERAETGVMLPPVDVIEDALGITLYADLPGVPKDKLHVRIDADALTIIEGALAASDTRVTDVMIPRAQMDVIDVDDPLAEIVPIVIEAAHSRFPVIDGDRDNVLGILLAKDMLRIHTEENFDLRDWLRPAQRFPVVVEFIPGELEARRGIRVGGHRGVYPAQRIISPKRRSLIVDEGGTVADAIERHNDLIE